MENTVQIRDAISDAATRAVDYWGTEHDEEAVILAELACTGLAVPRDEFRIMVEALIAFGNAEADRDLSGYGGPARPDAATLAAFLDDQKGEFEAALARVVDSLADAEIVPFPVRAARAAAA